MALNIIVIVLIGLICFIAGMTVEMFIITGELCRTREELSDTKEKLVPIQNTPAPQVQVIEINDPNAVVENDPFKPW